MQTQQWNMRLDEIRSTMKRKYQLKSAKTMFKARNRRASNHRQAPKESHWHSMGKLQCLNDACHWRWLYPSFSSFSASSGRRGGMQLPHSRSRQRFHLRYNRSDLQGLLPSLRQMPQTVDELHSTATLRKSLKNCPSTRNLSHLFSWDLRLRKSLNINKRRQICEQNLSAFSN